MEVLPQLKKSCKLLSNIPDKKDELLKAFEKLGVKYDEEEISLLGLLSLVFNVKWIDTINSPVSPKHEKYLKLKVQLPKARMVARYKANKQAIEHDFNIITSKESGQKTMADTKEIHEKVKKLDEEIKKSGDDEVSTLCGYVNIAFAIFDIMSTPQLMKMIDNIYRILHQYKKEEN